MKCLFASTHNKLNKADNLKYEQACGHESKTETIDSFRCYKNIESWTQA